MSNLILTAQNEDVVKLYDLTTLQSIDVDDKEAQGNQNGLQSAIHIQALFINQDSINF